MKFRSALITQGSGVLGTLVVEKNGVMRNRNIPANPNTAFQSAARSRVATFATQWRDDLTDVQRAAWIAYAATVSRKDALGKAIALTGINMFVAGNCALDAAGAGSVLAAPVTVGSLSVPDVVTAVFDASADTAVFTFADGVPSSVHCSLSMSEGAISPGRASYSGPYRHRQSVDGDDSTTVTFTGLTIASAGQKYAWELAFVDSEGRVARKQSSIATAVA